MPKPSIEKWNNIGFSIIDCKNVDQSNFYEYIKNSKKVRWLQFKPKLLSEDFNYLINNSVLYKIILVIDEIDSFQNIFQLLRGLKKDIIIEISSHYNELYVALYHKII